MNSNLLTNNDIPVLLIGYNRPNLLKKRIIEISQMPVRHLYLSIDGGPESHTKEMYSVIKSTRKILKNLETLEIIHHKENLGLVKHITSTITKILTIFNYIIVVEDDIKMSSNFYTNMINGFNFQTNNNITGIIGGFSPVSIKKFISNKWRISKYCVIWGWGCTAELWSDYIYDLGTQELNSNSLSSYSWNTLKKEQQELWINRFLKVQKFPYSTWDIQLQYLSFKSNFQNIYPVSTLVTNEGFSDYRAVHTKEQKPKWMLNYTGDERLIKVKKISNLSKFFEKYIDTNTIAGYTKIFQWWLKRKL